MSVFHFQNLNLPESNSSEKGQINSDKLPVFICVTGN